MRFNYKNITYKFLLIVSFLIIIGINKGFNYLLINGFSNPIYGTITSLLIISTIVYLTTLFFGSYLIQLNFHIKSLNKADRTINKIAITFDDGPTPQITENLLNVLEKHNVKATFFMIGKNIENNKNIVKKVDAQGHIIGNHSYYHANMFDMQSSKKMLAEITKTNKLIKSIINKEPTIFRPPFGITNPMLAKAVRKSKMHSIGWSLRSLDTIKTKNQTLKKIKSKVKNGDIILLHDNNNNIIEITEEFINYTKNIGIEIVSLEHLLKIKAYK